MYEIRIFQEKPGRVPLVEFLNGRKARDRAKIIAALEDLAKFGNNLRPPATEHLGDKLYYLRIRGEDGTYRIFYWPTGRSIVVLGHGFAKKTPKAPPEEIDRARRMRARYEADSAAHTFRGELT